MKLILPNTQWTTCENFDILEIFFLNTHDQPRLSIIFINLNKIFSYRQLMVDSLSINKKQQIIHKIYTSYFNLETFLAEFAQICIVKIDKCTWYLLLIIWTILLDTLTKDKI